MTASGKLFRGILAARTHAITIAVKPKGRRMFTDMFDGPWEQLPAELQATYDEIASLAFQVGQTMASPVTGPIIETTLARPGIAPRDGQSAFSEPQPLGMLGRRMKENEALLERALGSLTRPPPEAEQPPLITIRCPCGAEHSEFFCPHCGAIAQ